ncbi:hypothetical protein MPSEU_000456100 [Mayamaea pseudoterrestris]|nr:hypothetical protein MPSEU_000456100 [Mayamaea pseudoterrestris]
MPSLKRPRAKEAASTAASKTISPERWICSACTLENPARCRRCKACETRRPVVAASAADAAMGDAASSEQFGATRSAQTQQSTLVSEEKNEKRLSIKPARASRRNDTVSSTTKAKPRPNRKRKRPQSRPTSPNLLSIDAIQRDTMQHFTHLELLVRVKVQDAILPQPLYALYDDGDHVSDVKSDSECLVHVKVRNAILPQSLSAVFTIVADDHVSGVKCDSDSQETTRVNVPLNNNLHKSKLLNGFDESLTWRVRIKVQNESFPELLLAAIHAGDDEQPQLTIQPEISSATVKTTDCESEKNLYNNAVDFLETKALHSRATNPYNDAQDCCESLACDPLIKEMIDGDTNEEPSKERVEQDEAFIRQPLLLPLTRMTRPRAAPQETKKDSEQLPILSQLPTLENTPRDDTGLQMTPPASPTNKVHADATMCEKENYNRNLPGPSLARVKDASKVDSEVERKSLSSLTVDTKDKVFAESIKCKEESSHSNSPRQPSAAIDEASSVYPVGLASDNTLEAEEDSHLTQVASATDIFHADPTISDRESSHINLPCHTFAAPVQDLSSAGDTQLQPSTAELYSSQALSCSPDVNVEENIGSVVAALLDLSFEKRVPLDAGPIKFECNTSEQVGAIASTTMIDNASQSPKMYINSQPNGILNCQQRAANGGLVSAGPMSGEYEQAPDAEVDLHSVTFNKSILAVQRSKEAGPLLRESTTEAENGSSLSGTRNECSQLKRAREESAVADANLQLEHEKPAANAPPTRDFYLSVQSPPTEMQRNHFFYTQASQSQQSLDDSIETTDILQHTRELNILDLPYQEQRLLESDRRPDGNQALNIGIGNASSASKFANTSSVGFVGH